MKQINLSRNSKHYRLFKKITNLEPPMSLCPYFWIWVSIVIFFPFILLYKGIKYIHMKIRKHDELIGFEEKLKRSAKRKKMWFNISLYVERGAFIVGGLIVLGFFASLIYDWYKEGITWNGVFEVLKKIGIIVVSCVVFVSIGLGISYLLRLIFKPDTKLRKILSFLNKKFDQGIEFIAKILDIIGSVIYSKYKKMCPIIKWK